MRQQAGSTFLDGRTVSIGDVVTYNKRGDHGVARVTGLRGRFIDVAIIAGADGRTGERETRDVLCLSGGHVVQIHGEDGETVAAALTTYYGLTCERVS